jgi:IclR family transcriptional regulator, pca regulon regulatory protein
MNASPPQATNAITPTAIAPADFIAGMAKGMAVLESFDTQRQRLNATLTAQRTGLTRAAARRHLLTLTHLGYLETDGSSFWLSPKVLRFSGSYLASAQLPRVILPKLNQLAVMTQEAYSAVVLDADEVVIIARSDVRHGSTRGLAYGLHLGARLPAHATSTGRVLLAGMGKKDFAHWLKGRTLARLTAKTVTDAKTLTTLINQVRVDDYCLASDEHELGVTALAVPLRNRLGKTVAALNVVAPAAVHPEALLRERLPMLLQTAMQLREVL